MRLRFLLHTKSSVFCGGGETEREREQTRKSSREKWKTVKAIWRFKDARHPRHHQTCFSMFAAFNKRQAARLFSFRFRFILALSQWSAENKRIFLLRGGGREGKRERANVMPLNRVVMTSRVIHLSPLVAGDFRCRQQITDSEIFLVHFGSCGRVWERRGSKGEKSSMQSSMNHQWKLP
jgi:hypothetical protein